MLADIFKSLTKRWRTRGSSVARSKLWDAFSRYAEGNYAEACVLCEAALMLEPGLAEASYLLGVLACRGGDADSGARAIERALELSPGSSVFVAALADARLLQQREAEALALYSRAFPGQVGDLARLTDAGLPWKRAHPDWITRLKAVTLPLSEPRPDGAGMSFPVRIDDVFPGHLVNWALVLASRRHLRQAIHLLEKAVAANPRLGYAQSALALLHTLNRDWEIALAAAQAARRLGAEVFSGANDLCILAAQFGLSGDVGELDPVFDWSAFCGPDEIRDKHLERLPVLQGDAFPKFPTGVLIYFICCDAQYFFDHGIALACSIREYSPRSAVHLHLFNPTPEVWSALPDVATALAPLPLSATWESADFDRYGGKALYCACARFSRLYQLLLSTPNRVVMLDADSLVRGDLAAALTQRGEIGLVRAEYEPLWHQYLAGFTTFRRSPAAERFLRDLSTFLATNLATGHARLYLDQIGLYACMHRHRELYAEAVAHLPIATFCDTLFRDGALVWSVTQNKGEDSPFALLKRSVLRRYEDLRTARTC